MKSWHRNSNRILVMISIHTLNYNRIAASVNHPWDGIIDNNGPANDEEILKVIASLRDYQ